MNAFTFETVVTADRQLHCELPASFPVGSTVRVTVEPIVLDLGQPNVNPSEQKITFEEFLATRPVWPKDRPPVTLEEMEEAIIQGALDSANI